MTAVGVGASPAPPAAADEVTSSSPWPLVGGLTALALLAFGGAAFVFLRRHRPARTAA